MSKHPATKNVPEPRSQIDTSRAITSATPINRAPVFYPNELTVGEPKPNGK
jgi:hypothetical protein